MLGEALGAPRFRVLRGAAALRLYRPLLHVPVTAELVLVAAPRLPHAIAALLPAALLLLASSICARHLYGDLPVRGFGQVARSAPFFYQMTFAR